jgi:hypothetical protein
VVAGFPTSNVLVYVGPLTAVVDKTLNAVVLMYGVLRYVCEYKFDVVIELVVRERAFAIVAFCGNPKEFFRSQE